MQELHNPQTNEMLREFFGVGDVANAESALREKMDARATEMAPQGFTVVKRQKVGRNETCPCGSGRKFKRCCINQVR